MIILIDAGTKTPDRATLNAITAACGARSWYHIAVGDGPRHDENFVRLHGDLFAERLHAAVQQIIDEMVDEVAQEILTEEEA